MRVSYSEPYDGDQQYDYADFQEDDLTHIRRANQTAHAQGNGQERILQLVRSPSYGDDDTDVPNSQLGHGDFKNIKVTENPYYGVMSIRM